jgi:hypothetical protein
MRASASNEPASVVVFRSYQRARRWTGMRDATAVGMSHYWVHLSRASCAIAMLRGFSSKCVIVALAALAIAIDGVFAAFLIGWCAMIWRISGTPRARRAVIDDRARAARTARSDRRDQRLEDAGLPHDALDEASALVRQIEEKRGFHRVHDDVLDLYADVVIDLERRRRALGWHRDSAILRARRARARPDGRLPRILTHRIVQADGWCEDIAKLLRARRRILAWLRARSREESQAT